MPELVAVSPIKKAVQELPAGLPESLDRVAVVSFANR